MGSYDGTEFDPREIPANPRRVDGVRRFEKDAATFYAFEVESDGERPWRAVTGGTCYLGFESRLEALVFVSVKKAEALADHLGLESLRG